MNRTRTLNKQEQNIIECRTIESLESRRMLAVTLDGDLLDITGERGPDDIVISIDDQAGTIFVDFNGEESSFDLEDVFRIRVNAGRGHDFISVEGFVEDLAVSINS